MASQGMVSLENAEHYTWGDGCDAWYLVKNDNLTIIQERMPPGTSETLHRHDRSRQFFYIVAGTAVMEHDGEVPPLDAGQGLEIAPGVTHKIRSASAQSLQLIVTSQPPSHTDRIEVKP